MFRYTIALAALTFAFPAFAKAQEAEKPRVVLSVDFENTQVAEITERNANPQPTITTDANEVISGERSLKGDSQASNAEWNEYFHSRTGIFRAKDAYRVSFDYKVLARMGNAQFYILARRADGNKSAGWKSWEGKPGDTGRIETAFVTRGAGDYRLVFGIQNKGAVTIDNIRIETDPANRPLDVQFPNPKRTWQSPGRTAYYADALLGDDANDGKSAKRPWRTLDKINAGTFAAGDKIFLKAGCAWKGFLAPGGSGKPGRPILIDRYGYIGKYEFGDKPQIDGEGKYLATLSLFNVEGWEIRNLDIANKGKVREPNLAGVSVRLENFGTAHHITLKNLRVHDVTGSLVKSEGGGSGIICANGGDKVKSRFDGLLIDKCRLERTDRNGIGFSGYWSRADWFPNLRVVIRRNVLLDIGGDGIVPIACDGAIVEENVIHGCRMRCEDSAAGIWPWSCDNTIVQSNEVSGMKGTVDGQGFDSDWNCRNTIFQYNYSHDNDGGFMLICNDGDVKLPWSVGNVGTIIRYNISQNDGERTFHLTGPCRDTQIYNNTIYIGPKLNIYAVQAGNWGGDWTENTQFINNIFYADGKARFNFGGMRLTTFDHNAYFGNLENRPDDKKPVLADPKLMKPGSGGDGLDSLGNYRLARRSPCANAGRGVKRNGGRDFWGRPLLSGNRISIGAWQANISEPPPMPMMPAGD